jgi:hypothetical protein
VIDLTTTNDAGDDETVEASISIPACPTGWVACGSPVEVCCSENSTHCETDPTSGRFYCAAGSLMSQCMEDCKEKSDAATGD